MKVKPMPANLAKARAACHWMRHAHSDIIARLKACTHRDQQWKDKAAASMLRIASRREELLSCHLLASSSDFGMLGLITEVAEHAQALSDIRLVLCSGPDILKEEGQLHIRLLKRIVKSLTRKLKD